MTTLGRMLETAEEGCNPFVYFNRELRPEAVCALPPGCRAVALGEACFETFRLRHDNRVAAFEGHLRRLQRGAEALGYESGRHHTAFRFSAAEMARDLLKLRRRWAVLKRSPEEAARFERQDFRLRIQLGRADSSGIYDDAAENVAFFSLIRMFVAGPPSQNVRLWISSARRIPDKTLRQDIKWSFYVPNVQLIRLARQHGADDALLLDGRGNISEAATANVFFFIGGRLVTPPESSDGLAGITRAEVLEAARAAGLPVEETPVSPEQARTAAAGFITNSMRGISPIEAIDGQPLSVNHTGLRRVMQVFDAHLKASATDLAFLHP